MGPLRMAWSTEKGRLVCHWVEFARQQELLRPANVPGSVVLASGSTGPDSGVGRCQRQVPIKSQPFGINVTARRSTPIEVAAMSTSWNWIVTASRSGMSPA